MDLRSLRLEAKIHLESQGVISIRLLNAAAASVKLEPNLLVFPNEEGILELKVPPHLNSGSTPEILTVPVRIVSSDKSGVSLSVQPLKASAAKDWKLFLRNLEDLVGRQVRVHRRLTIPEFGMEAELIGPPVIRFKIFDISEGGIRILTTEELNPDEEISLRLIVPDHMKSAYPKEDLIAKAVVQNLYPHGAGLEFVEDPTFASALQSLVLEIVKRRAERLKNPRYNLSHLEVQGSLFQMDEAPDKGIKVHLQDISLTGCHVKVQNPISVGSTVAVTVAATNSFHSLSNSLSLSGNVLRNTPEGVVVVFDDLAPEIFERLSVWTQEASTKISNEGYRPRVPLDPVEEPKRTVSIRYTKDLLFVREYLYNLSSGGFFLKGDYPFNTGEVVKVVIDLTALKIKTGKSSPSFAATIVRKTDTGLGLQIRDPDKVRLQLDPLISEFMRHSPRNSDDTLAYAADIAASSLSAPGKRLAQTKPNSTGPLVFGIPLVIVLGVASYYFWFRGSSESDLSPEDVGGPPAVATPSSDAQMRLEPTPPPTVRVIVDGGIERVDPAEVVDITYEEKKGVLVLMKDNRLFPADPFIPYLSKPLLAKLKMLKGSGGTP